MRHPIWYRVLISLWAVWFSTALIEPAGFFACAMHSGMGAVTSTAPAHAANLTHHEHAASHAGASASAPAAETAEPEHEGHPCCTCLGQCSTMTANVVARVDVTIEEVLSRQASVQAAIVLTRVPVRPAHALPFANGPPPGVRA
ncbi:hypothetical protein [Gemmatimonas groenlandica]|uniref:DUF2946 domain-containing protein n=1 Tax=Gemmatimonas groenlandica TaxID=2732249 RepID=A0A6M4IU71_9BACT|nr:hypothetical protein [Gemmatimonas groenlandica]QJR37289.1 hypothetical protein HKW67_18100 [Gemmatimonas groenlandica]